jgi:hypothetical protein
MSAAKEALARLECIADPQQMRMHHETTDRGNVSPLTSPRTGPQRLAETDIDIDDKFSTSFEEISIDDSMADSVNSSVDGGPDFCAQFAMRPSCTECAVVFSLFNRRHHCRSCGSSVCSEHSSMLNIRTCTNSMYASDLSIRRTCSSCKAQVVARHRRASLQTEHEMRPTSMMASLESAFSPLTSGRRLTVPGKHSAKISVDTKRSVISTQIHREHLDGDSSPLTPLFGLFSPSNEQLKASPVRAHTAPRSIFQQKKVTQQTEKRNDQGYGSSSSSSSSSEEEDAEGTRSVPNIATTRRPPV